MQWVPLVFTFVVASAIYSLILKLSAMLLRFRIQWAHAFVFAQLMGLCSLIANLGSAATGYRGIAPVLALVAMIVLGAWFFATRGMRANAQPIGRKGGATLVAVAVAIGIVIGIGLILLVHLARPSA